MLWEIPQQMQNKGNIGVVMILEIRDLRVETGGKVLIDGLNLSIRENEIHVIMGPNGSGKTTLSKTIMGFPSLKITKGEILLDGRSIKDLPANERAALGLFLQFQDPVEIEGAKFITFMRTAKDAVGHGETNVKQLVEEIRRYSKELGIEGKIFEREGINKGFSGGERKKSEMLQLAILDPEIALLDEPDSGLDVDALKSIASFIDRRFKEKGKGAVIITHNGRMLSYLRPNFVHIMVDGRIASSGGMELVEKIEREGYDSFKAKGI